MHGMMGFPDTARAAAIDESEVIGAVEALVSQPSVSGAEDAISRSTADALRGLGLDVVEQEVLPGRRNVIATLDTGRPGPTLMFNGHLDTLPVPDGGTADPYTPRRIGDRLFGAEINNMKAAVGAMSGCMAALARGTVGLNGRVVLSAVIGECDALGLGTTHMLAEGVTADAAINGEPTDLNLLTAHAGVSQLRLRVSGVSAHICQRSAGRNAIDGLVAALGALDESVLRFEPHDEFVGLPTLNVGAISGGGVPSMLAAQAEALIDVRTVPGMTPDGVKADVERAIEGIEALDASVELLQPPAFCQQYPYRVAPDEAIVRTVAEAHQAVCGAAPHIGPLIPQVFFGTDASHLLRAGIPTVIYGPGKVDDINQPDESIAVADFLTAAKVYYLSALAVCGEN